jgi:hypothetical protein
VILSAAVVVSVVVLAVVVLVDFAPLAAEDDEHVQQPISRRARPIRRVHDRRDVWLCRDAQFARPARCAAMRARRLVAANRRGLVQSAILIKCIRLIVLYYYC